MNSKEQLNNWIKEKLPKLKKKYNIHCGRKARGQAETVAYIVKESFLKNVTHSDSNRLQITADLIANYIYYKGYDIGIRCDYDETTRINVVDKNQEPQNLDKFGELILKALK